MTDLILCLGTGKGTWAEAAKLIQAESWRIVFIVTNAFGKEKFQAPTNAAIIVIDEFKHVKEITETIRKTLEGKIQDMEVAVNIISGSGKVHTAMFSAILKLGLAIRLVAMTEKGMEEV